MSIAPWINLNTKSLGLNRIIEKQNSWLRRTIAYVRQIARYLLRGLQLTYDFGSLRKVIIFKMVIPSLFYVIF
jgi:hypothetical protein